MSASTTITSASTTNISDPSSAAPLLPSGPTSLPPSQDPLSSLKQPSYIQIPLTPSQAKSARYLPTRTKDYKGGDIPPCEALFDLGVTYLDSYASIKKNQSEKLAWEEILAVEKSKWNAEVILKQESYKWTYTVQLESRQADVRERAKWHLLCGASASPELERARKRVSDYLYDDDAGAMVAACKTWRDEEELREWDEARRETLGREIERADEEVGKSQQHLEALSQVKRYNNAVLSCTAALLLQTFGVLKLADLNFDPTPTGDVYWQPRSLGTFTDAEKEARDKWNSYASAHPPVTSALKALALSSAEGGDGVAAKRADGKMDGGEA